MVSPDAGGVERARAMAKRLHAGLAVIDKRRPEVANKVEGMTVVGEVEGATCCFYDDIVDTAGTLTKAAEAVMEKGAKEVYAFATHPVLSGPATRAHRGQPLQEGLRDRHDSTDSGSRRLRQDRGPHRRDRSWARPSGASTKRRASRSCSSDEVR